jgi:hypothetical protein
MAEIMPAADDGRNAVLVPAHRQRPAGDEGQLLSQDRPPEPGRFKERLAIPGYIKDVVAWTKQPLTTAKHKVHPLITAIADMLQNEEWYRKPIRNPEDPLVQQAADVAAYMARQFEPFSFRYFRKAREEGESVPESMRSFVGVTKAPLYVTERPGRPKSAIAQARERRVWRPDRSC